MEHALFLAALVVGVVAVLFEVIGLATPDWFQWGDVAHLGLFKYCVPAGCAEIIPTDRLKAVRAFAIIGFLLAVAGQVIDVIYYLKFIKNNEQKPLLPLLSGNFFVFSGSCTLLAVILMVTADKDPRKPDPDVGYSLVLSALGFVTAVVTGILVLVFRKKAAAA